MWSAAKSNLVNLGFAKFFKLVFFKSEEELDDFSSNFKSLRSIDFSEDVSVVPATTPKPGAFPYNAWFRGLKIPYFHSINTFLVKVTGVLGVILMLLYFTKLPCNYFSSLIVNERPFDIYNIKNIGEVYWKPQESGFFGLSLKNVKIDIKNSDPSQGVQSITIPNLKLAFKPFNYFIGKSNLYDLSLVSPKIQLTLDDQNQIINCYYIENIENKRSRFIPIENTDFIQAAFSIYNIENGTISVEKLFVLDDNTEEVYSKNYSLSQICWSNNNLSALYKDDNGNYANLNYKSSKDFNVQLNHISPSALYDNINFILPSTNKSFFEHFGMIEAPLSGKMTSNGSVVKFDLTINNPQRISIQDGVIEGTVEEINENFISLNINNFRFLDNLFKGKIIVQKDYNLNLDGKFNFVDFESSNIPNSNVSQFFKLINLKVNTINKLEFEGKCLVNFQENVIKSFSGQGMAEIKNDSQKMVLNFSNDSIALNASNIIIHGFNFKNLNLKLNENGVDTEVLAQGIVNNYSKDISLINGNNNAVMEFLRTVKLSGGFFASFKLPKNIANIEDPSLYSQEIWNSLSFKAVIDDINLPISFANYQLMFKEGRGDLLIDNNSLQIKSVVDLEGAPLNLLLKIKDKEQKITVSGKVNHNNLKNIVPDVERFMQGDVDLKLLIIKKPEQGDYYKLNLDAKNAKVYLPIINWLKDVNKDMNVAAIFDVNARNEISVKEFNVDSSEMQANLSAVFANNNISILCPRLQTPLQDMAFRADKIADNGWNIYLNSRLLNLMGYPILWGMPEYINNLELKSEYLLLNNLEAFKSVQASIKKSDKAVKVGEIKGVVNDKEFKVSLSSANKTKEVKQKVDIIAKDAGAFLKALGVTESWMGGVLSANLTYSTQSQTPYVGRVSIEGGSTHEDSIVSQLLNFTTPGKGHFGGVYIDHLASDVIINIYNYPYTIHLNAGTASSASCDVDIAGNIDMVNRTWDINGSISSRNSYQINVPYTIKGYWEKPILWVGDSKDDLVIVPPKKDNGDTISIKALEENQEEAPKFLPENNVIPEMSSDPKEEGVQHIEVIPLKLGDNILKKLNLGKGK